MPPQEHAHLKARRKQRHCHVYVTLRVLVNGRWHRTRALDWNEDGFNFYLQDSISEGCLRFKKDLREFSGIIVWRVKNDDDGVILEKIINNLIFGRLKQISSDTSTLQRIFKMIRTVGMLEGKKKLLALAGLSITEKELQALTDRYKSANPLYRYGVKVDAPEWTDIVKFTLQAASPAQAMDELVKELSELVHHET